jgi:hypothetical protein
MKVSFLISFPILVMGCNKITLTGSLCTTFCVFVDLHVLFIFYYLLIRSMEKDNEISGKKFSKAARVCFGR